jgi:integrase
MLMVGGYGYKVSKEYAKKWKKKLPPGPTLHDFRRSMATNALEAGIPEKVIMEMGGWKTPSVFRRYCIVKKEHLEKAALQQEEYLKSQAKKRGSSYSIVTVDEFKEKKKGSAN